MADRQSEPSIDEILSSIRKVIAEDDVIDKGKNDAAFDTISSTDKSASKNDKAQRKDDILELTSPEDDDLVNPETAQGLRQSLSTLAALSEPSARPQIVRSGETSLESLVTEMLRPMMKEWLDQNLPPLVESMVEREIKRITKKD